MNVIAAGQFSRDGEELADGGDGVGGDDVAVDGGDGDVGSGGAEGVGEVLAGGFGAEEEEAGGGSVGLEGVGEEGFGEGFGYGLRGEEDRGGRGGFEGRAVAGADGGDAEVGGARDYPGLRSETWGTRFRGGTDEAAVEGFYGVGAGEEEPVEGSRWARAASRGAKVVGSASSMVGMRMGSAPRARSWSASAEAWWGERVMRTRGAGMGSLPFIFSLVGLKRP